MFELMLCSMFTILPDYFFRRYGQGKKIGREITLYSVWFELRWRASELRGLAWDHIDFEERKIRVRQRADRWNHLGSPKSKGSRRDIPMPPAVIAALKEWQLACPPGPIVFPTGTGKVESHANIRRAIGPIMIEAGLVDDQGKPKFGLHALRHFYASWLIDQGLNPKRVQTPMGHSTLAHDHGHLREAV